MRTDLRRYLVSGVLVETDLPLTGTRQAPGKGHPDLVIRSAGQRSIGSDIPAGELLQTTSTQGGPLYSTVREPSGRFLLRLHRRVDFEISPDTRTVLAWPDPDCAPGMVALLAAGNLIATVLALRGETVLHASAVAIADRAVAFVGRSGVGKSTLAALACARGAQLVTDDLLRPQAGSCPVRAWPGAVDNRLRRDVADLSPAHAGAHTETSVDGRVVWRPQAVQAPQVELAAIVLPQPLRAGGSLELHPAAPAIAVFELTRRPRILGWLDEAIRRQSFENLSLLARTVPIYRALVPWGPPFDPAVTDELLALTREGTRLPAG